MGVREILKESYQISRKAITYCTNFITEVHNMLMHNIEASGAWVKMFFTFVLVLYLPIMAFMGANLLKNFDDKYKGEATKVNNASYTNAILSAQQHIIESLPSGNNEKNDEERKNKLKLLKSQQEIANKQITYNANWIGFRQESYEIILKIIIATGSLQIGIVMAEATNKVKRSYILYFGISIGILGIIIAVQSAFALGKFSIG